jgi:DNA-binding NarL/FixJ family response regulator
LDRIRIVLAELPRMLRDIVSEAIGRQSDMLIVGELDRCEEEPTSTGPDTFDVVIAGLENDSLDDRQIRLMQDHPRVKLLGITGDARRTFLFELRPHRIALGAASPDGLVAAIRQAAAVGNGGGSR